MGRRFWIVRRVRRGRGPLDDLVPLLRFRVGLGLDEAEKVAIFGHTEQACFILQVGVGAFVCQ